MTTGQSGAKAPDRNRGRKQPQGPRRRATYEDNTGTAKNNKNNKNNKTNKDNKDNKDNLKARPAPPPKPAAS